MLRVARLLWSPSYLLDYKIVGLFSDPSPFHLSYHTMRTSSGLLAMAGEIFSNMGVSSVIFSHPEKLAYCAMVQSPTVKNIFI